MTCTMIPDQKKKKICNASELEIFLGAINNYETYDAINVPVSSF